MPLFLVADDTRDTVKSQLGGSSSALCWQQRNNFADTNPKLADELVYLQCSATLTTQLAVGSYEGSS